MIHTTATFTGEQTISELRPRFININKLITQSPEPTFIRLKKNQAVIFVKEKIDSHRNYPPYLRDVNASNEHFDLLAFPKIAGLKVSGQPGNT